MDRIVEAAAAADSAQIQPKQSKASFLMLGRVFDAGEGF
jgi:hypothetical protein